MESSAPFVVKMRMTKTPTNLMTVEEAAAYLKVDPKTVYRLINDKEIKAFLVGRVYRFEMKDIEDFVQKSKLKVQRAAKRSY